MRFKIYCLILFFYLSSAFSQLPVKRDDYVGNNNRNWWRWYNDGPSTPVPAVSDGYVLFSLTDPVASYNPYCDAAFWDGYPAYGGPYRHCTVTLRAKALNAHKYGSRGWGLWYTEPEPNVQQQAWFMHLLDDPDSTGINSWRAETTYDKTETRHHYTDLDAAPYFISDQDWHVYKIDWQTDHVHFIVDSDTVLTVTQDIPDHDLAFHIWVDNLVYEHVDPDTINIYKRGWVGQNDIVLDYVQIVTPDGQLDKSETAEGIKLLRQVPNEVYTSESAGLWHDYTIASPGGSVVVLATARVEQYLDATSAEISGDDDIRLVVDGTDYGWNSSASFNGDAAGTVAKTLVWQQTMTSGSKDIEVYGETSPMLYDITALGGANGGIIYNQEFNETKTEGSAELWKEISFQTHGGDVAFYISGSADEDPNPNNYGFQLSDFDDNNDDDLKIVIDGADFGYRNDSSLWGNRQFGEPGSVLLVPNLTQGQHTLRLYGVGTPTLYRVLIYGENDDEPLPVSLSSFTVQRRKEGSVIQWITESEINNAGFNLFRAATSDSIAPAFASFQQLNQKLIAGQGNSSRRNIYSYTDAFDSAAENIWYLLQDVSYSGLKQNYGPLMLSASGNLPVAGFTLSGSYPNPFGASNSFRSNPVTTIRFNLDKAGKAQLSVYDMRGRLIRRLLQENLEAGAHSAQWNGRDKNGAACASGLYLIRLQYNHKNAVRKMVLLR